ncbi:MAG: DUF2079 domain-containing protein [Prolixibacteraceae bacterium]
MKLQVRRKHIPVIILVFFGLLISYIGIYNHYLFKTFTYDYANYNFAFWDYSHFRLSPLPTFRGNFLQDHFSFTLMYFIPVYWLINWLTGTYTLIIIQNSLILLAAWYSYKLIKLETDNLWLTSGVILYFFLLFGRYSAFGTDVNLAIMAACFVPVFLYYFEIRKYLIAFIILILSLFSRENMPIWFIFIFVVLMLMHWKEKKAVIYSLAGIVVSIVYFIILFKVFIPGIETPGVKYALFNYSALGSGPGEALKFTLLHPLETIKLFFVNHLSNPEYNKVKLEFYITYLISGGFVLLYRPKYMIWFIPIVAQKVLNDDFFRWGLATYYSVEIVTFLPISVFLVLSSIKTIKLQNALAGLVCVCSLAMTIHKMDSSNHQVPWTFYKAKIKFYDKSFYEPPFDVKKVNQLLKQIPENAKVSASNIITPHIAQRQFIYFFPTVKDADYIVFSMLDNNYLMSAEENDKHRNNYLGSPEWQIIEKEYPVFLLKKKTEVDSLAPITNKTNELTDTLTCNFEITDKDKKHVLLSNNTKADTIIHVGHDYFRSKNSSLCLTQADPYSHGISLNDIKNTDQIEVSVWYLGSDNTAIVIDNKENLYQKSDGIETVDENGWKKITLKCYLKENQKLSSTIIYLWNAGIAPIYFDDMQIIKRHY